ncbi:MAG: TonB-dependent receptor, partial [Gemmatimonadaceae bacterium]|nr:TonB-dependent receptor [Gemmatimonadaceae bacterium]
PYASSVRTAASLAQGTPATALDDALRGVPGIQVDNRFNYALGERISVRGAGARAQFGVRGVRVLIDGIPATLPDGQTTLNQVDLSTVDAVEVLRGPVSSLFGNAAGGAILIETRGPPASPFAARATVTSGSNGLLRTLGEGGGSNGQLGYMARVSRVAFDGFRSHSTAENTYAAARLSWLGTRNAVTASLNAVRYEAQNPGSLSDSLLRANRNRAFQNNVAQATGETGSHRQAGVQWRRALSAEDALEVTGWVIGRTVDNPIPARIVVVDRRAGGTRALLRGDRARLAWSAGIEHERQHDDRQNYLNTAGSRGALVLDQGERVSAIGAFAQASALVHRRVTALVGVRHDRTGFRAEDRIVTATNPDDSGRRTLDALSPSAGLSLSLDGGVTVYSNVGTAFETPTTTELANRPDGAGGFNPTLEPQRTVSYEVGARHARGESSAQLAVFHAVVRDALIPFEVANVPGRQFFRNAGRTGTRGVEAAGSTPLGEAIRVEANYTFTDAQFRSYSIGSATYDGNSVPGVAPHRAGASLSYVVRGTALAADVRHQSRMAVDDANTAWSPAFTLADLRVQVRAIHAGKVRLRLAGGVQNVLGAEYNASVVVNAFGRRYFEPGPGRTAHVGVTVD